MVKARALKYGYYRYNCPGELFRLLLPIHGKRSWALKSYSGILSYSKWYNFGGSDEIRAKDINNTRQK